MKKLSTMLLSATLAVSMIAPVAAEGIKEELKAEKTTIAEQAKDVVEAVKENSEEATEKAKEITEKAGEEVKETAEKVEEKAKEVAEKVKEDAKEVKEEVKEEIKKEEEMKVKVSPQKVTLDGKEVKISGYNIKDENYFKLRDVAAVLKDTDAKFAVDYKEADKDAKGQVVLTPGKEYEVLDTDLKEVKAESVAIGTNDEVKVVDKDLEAKAYKIDGNNYYRLRDIAKTLNFGVDYDKETNTVVLTSKVEEAKEEVKKETEKVEKAEEKVEEAKEKVEDKKEEVKEKVEEKKEEVKEVK